MFVYMNRYQAMMLPKGKFNEFLLNEAEFFVGYFTPDGTFIVIYMTNFEHVATARVHYLNGGNSNDE